MCVCFSDDLENKMHNMIVKRILVAITVIIIKKKVRKSNQSGLQRM